MLHQFGRFLQFIGLFIIVPLAIAGQVLNHLSVGQMFLIAAVGALAFYFGATLLRKG